LIEELKPLLDRFSSISRSHSDRRGVLTVASPA
jgi:hypothetical protein